MSGLAWHRCDSASCADQPGTQLSLSGVGQMSSSCTPGQDGGAPALALATSLNYLHGKRVQETRRPKHLLASDTSYTGTRGSGSRWMDRTLGAGAHPTAA